MRKTHDPLARSAEEKAAEERGQEARRAMTLLPKLLMLLGVMRGPLTRKEILAVADDWIGLKPDRGADRIMLERLRQLESKGYEAAHDDKHNKRGELALAAIHYACPPGVSVEKREVKTECGPQGRVRARHFTSEVWPWEPEADKRDKHSRLEQLAIAGALLAAEIDRLLRVEATPVLPPTETAPLTEARLDEIAKSAHMDLCTSSRLPSAVTILDLVRELRETRRQLGKPVLCGDPTGVTSTCSRPKGHMGNCGEFRTL